MNFELTIRRMTQMTPGDWLRLVVTMLLMMVVGINEVKA